MSATASSSIPHTATNAILKEDPAVAGDPVSSGPYPSSSPYHICSIFSAPTTRGKTCCAFVFALRLPLRLRCMNQVESTRLWLWLR